MVWHDLKHKYTNLNWYNYKQIITKAWAVQPSSTSSYFITVKRFQGENGLMKDNLYEVEGELRVGGLYLVCGRVGILYLGCGRTSVKPEKSQLCPPLCGTEI